MEISLNKLRCPYCHDGISGSLHGCSCGAIYHLECYKNLENCASCYQSFNPQVMTPRPKQQEPLIKKFSLDTSSLTEKHLQSCIESLLSLPDFDEAYDIARTNAKGSIWLVGGKLYRTIIHQIYGYRTDYQNCDFDFLTTKVKWWRSIPERWKYEYHDYSGYGPSLENPYDIKKVDGAIRFIRPARITNAHIEAQQDLERQCGIDLIPISSAPGIKLGKFPHSLDGYFASVPFDIQAIAMDVENRKIIGPGLKAIGDHKICVNFELNAKNLAARLGKSLPDLLEEKSLSLGFVLGQIRKDGDSKNC